MIVTKEEMQQAFDSATGENPYGIKHPGEFMAMAVFNDMAARGFAHQAKLGHARYYDEMMTICVGKVDKGVK